MAPTVLSLCDEFLSEVFSVVSYVQMELALTYASRTHRIRLARQINELMQQKALEQDERSDEEEEEEGEELEMGAGLAGSDMYGDHGSDLSRGRRHFHGGACGGMAGSMRRSDLRRGGMETGSRGSNSRFKLSSRSSEVKYVCQHKYFIKLLL